MVEHSEKVSEMVSVRVNATGAVMCGSFGPSDAPFGTPAKRCKSPVAFFETCDIRPSANRT